MVSRAKRNVVQWSGRPRDAALGIGEARPAEAEGESSRPNKRAGAKKKKKPDRKSSVPFSTRITADPDGWRGLCSCGFTRVCTSKGSAKIVLAEHSHLRSKAKPSLTTRQQAVPYGGRVTTVVQTPPSEVLAMWTFRWGQLTLDQQEAFLSHPQMPRIVGKNRMLIRRAISLHQRLSDIADFVNGKK